MDEGSGAILRPWLIEFCGNVPSAIGIIAEPAFEEMFGAKLSNRNIVGGKIWYGEAATPFSIAEADNWA